MKRFVAPITLLVAGISIVGAIIWLERLKIRPSGAVNASDSIVIGMDLDNKARKFQRAKKIVAPFGFINTTDIKIEDLIGKKVIMVDFWTYSCINCQRTLPYMNAWYDKYKDQGLEIIGVHAPEFDFEKKIENVQWAVNHYDVRYPVVLDNDYGTWQAYGNRYWPRKYLIDIDGYIVYDHIGEGGYDETEKKIQELLSERMTRLGEQGNVSTGTVVPTSTEQAADARPRSPEIYFGSSRNTYLGNGTDGVAGIQQFTEPRGVKTNILYMVGTWDIQPEFAKNTVSGSKIVFRYQGAKVYMVARADSTTRVRILRDGAVISDAAGSDVRDGVITISEDRLYHVVDDPNGWGEHTLEIIVDDPGAELFTFTFG